MKTVSSQQRSFSFPLILLLLYVIVEYGKPIILSPIRPALILQIVFLLLFLRDQNKVRVMMKDRYFILYIILLIEMMIHVPIAQNNYWALQFFFTMLSYLIFSLAFCLFLDTPAKLKLFLAGYIIIHAVIALDEVLTGRKYVGGKGVMGDTNDVALDFVVLIPISLYLGFSYTGIKRISIWLITTVFVLGTMATVSRGGFVGMAAVGLVCLLQAKSKVKSLLILSFVVILFVSVIPRDYKAELFSIERQGTEYGTGRDRIELWKIAWKMFLANPVIGIGQGNTPWTIEHYQDFDNSYWHRGIGGRVTHSVYFTLLPELGIVGTIIWILMLSNLFLKYRSVVKHQPKNNATVYEHDDPLLLKNIMLGLSAGVVGFLVSGAFLSAFYYPEFWNVAALITSVYMIQQTSSMKNWSTQDLRGLVPGPPLETGQIKG